MAKFAVSTCACGHNRAAHEHFRRGSDCGACGASACARFHSTAPTPLNVLVAVIQRLRPCRRADHGSDRELASSR
jgi:hypothetical protein